MGAVQRLATMVMIGLVALATILVLYIADEPNRLDAEEEEQKEASIERGMESYVTYCVSCHGPGGEGYETPGEQGTGRVGAPLGGNTLAREANQEGTRNGTPVAGGLEGRTTIIHETITNGRGTIMPAWKNDLNLEQINDLVVMIQNVDWDRVYNEAVEVSGGYPTPPPGATAEATETPEGNGGEAAGVTIVMGKPAELAFDPSDQTIQAGTDVAVTLTNEGVLPHNLSIDELNISVDLQPGESTEITINAPAGEYEYYCNIPGHREGGMVGTLTASEEAPPAGGDQPADGGQGGGAQTEFALTAGKPAELAFDPADMTIPANTDDTITLTNSGVLPHNYSIDALGISVDVQPGETVEIPVNAAAGEYEIHCNIPGHREGGMVGRLVAQ